MKLKTLHKHLPNISHRHLVFVLATQRSGSTLLCEDLSQFRKIGHPNEYFLNVLHSQGQDSEKISRFIQSATQSEGEGFALKIMENYLDAFISFCISGDTSNTRRSIAERVEFFDTLAKLAKRVSLIFLERDSLFEQAFSHHRAKSSGTWHSTDLKSKEDTLPSVSSFSENSLTEFLFMLAETEVQRARLREMRNTLSLPSIALTYNAVIDPEQEYLKEVAQYLELVEGDDFVAHPRVLSKLTKGREVEEAKSSFLKLIGM